MTDRVEELRSPTVRALIDELKLAKLELEHRDLVSRMLLAFPPLISEYTFSNLYAWNNPQRWIGVYKDHMLVGQEFPDQMLFLHPVGKNPVEIMRELGGLMGVTWTRVAETLAECLRGEFEVLPQREHFDYVYHRPHIDTLNHPQLKKHRSRIERFERDFRPAVVPLNQNYIGECERILNIWTGTKEPDKDLRKEVDAASTALKHFVEWNLYGIGVLVDSLLVAYAIAEALSEKTYVVHYTKTLPNFGELPRFLFRALVRGMPSDVERVNSMQDLDIPGLRTAKQEWRPSHMIEKYLVSKKP